MLSRTLVVLFPMLTLFSTSVRAHHGLDFLLLQDGTIPKQGSVMFFDNTEWSTANGAEEWGTEPGLHLGLTPWLAAGVTTSIMDEGDGWHFLSTTPYLNIPLLASDRVPWLRISAYVGYELPDNVAQFSKGKTPQKKKSSTRTVQNVTSTATKPSLSKSKRAFHPVAQSTTPARSLPQTRHTTGGSVGGGGPDAPSGGTTHDHPVATTTPSETSTLATPEPTPVLVSPVEEHYLGIHRHGEEGLHARLIIDVELTDHDKVIGNLINFTPPNGRPAWGYALGYRHAFTHDLAASLEAIGDFDGRGSHEVLIGAHFTINHSLTLKLGAGLGLTDNSSDASIHSGVVWRF